MTGHLVTEALSLGAQHLICPIHDEEMWIVGSKTGRLGHLLKTLDGRKAVCVGGAEVVEVR